MVIAEGRVRELLQPFRLNLSARQVGQLVTYLDLLLRWNRRINLTSLDSAELSVTRHFGESLYLATAMTLRGNLLDIGSGAGFPGLALKIVFPDLRATLLEPAAKKRAFLKEVARACQFEAVEVRGERVQEFAARGGVIRFDTVTARAVGQWPSLLEAALPLLVSGGRLAFWLTEDQSASLAEAAGMGTIRWLPPLPIPLSRQREILVGVLAGGPYEPSSPGSGPIGGGIVPRRLRFHVKRRGAACRMPLRLLDSVQFHRVRR